MPTLKWIAEHVETIHIHSEETACVNCAHFHLHYVKCRSEYKPIYQGHCTATQRFKDRKAGDRCPMFEQRKTEVE